MKKKLLGLFLSAMKYLLIFTILLTVTFNLVIANNSTAQEIKSVREVYLTIGFEKQNLMAVFSEIEDRTPYFFGYEKAQMEGKERISIPVQHLSIAELLLEVAKQTPLRFRQVNNNIDVIPVSEKESDALEVVLLQRVTGTITDENNEALPGVSVYIKGSTVGTITDVDGKFAMDVPSGAAVLIFSFVGMKTIEMAVGDQSVINLTMKSDATALDEVVVMGYGTQTKESITGSVATVSSDDLKRVKSATVSASLAGKIPGVSFRQADGRPGAGATIQIRNMGSPLYVIDGIQKDEGQFNNISPNDIETITVLKDASAAIYGSRAANGVVIVTTKRGEVGTRPTVNIDAYYGWQNWSRYPEGVNAYEWMLGKADAEMNQFGNTAITAEELAKWKDGTEYGYKSFNWSDFIIGKNAPQASVSANVSGGSERTNYYFSVTHLNQDAVLDQYNFKRTNIQTNVDTRIADRLKIGVSINGRIESRKNPGVPGGDDYWAPRFALIRNRPTERPYANDNPAYPNDIGHNVENWALHNFEISGYWESDWRVVQTNFNAEYETPVKGLTVKGMYSYYFADNLLNGHEYTYDVYTYDPATDVYNITGGSSNPWRERNQRKVLENVAQAQLNYNNAFDKHSVAATFVVERIERTEMGNWVHTVPTTNVLPLLQFADMDTYNDYENVQARIGYVGRVAYNYDNKYFFEVAGRRDASWKFASGKRWGNFPSISGGWSISSENFYQSLGMSKILTDFKLRASYGKLGDDNVGIGAFDYITGYNYGVSTVILDDQIIRGSRYRGVPVNNISWFTSTTTDIGADFSLWSGKLRGSLDYFYRKRTGLRGRKYDVLVPNELGYSLPDENVNSDAQLGGEASLYYTGTSGDIKYNIGGNFSYSRSRKLETYKPRFGNSWDHYRNSTEDRWDMDLWGYQIIGQFQSQEEINSYPVNVDNQGNRTLLPGDFIYNDVNGDGIITAYDQRPIGYEMFTTPAINFGFNLSVEWKGIDLTADFSGGSMYTFNRHWELRNPYQNTGNLLTYMYDDRWHRADPLNLDSEWIPGKNPPLRFNNRNHSNNNRDSDWWRVNVNYLRLRTLEIGYALPADWLEKVKMQGARIYLNTYNLVSFDNVKQYGIDPEITDENGLQYPQNVLVNVGINLSL